VKNGGLGDFVQMTAVAKALKTRNPRRPVVAVVELHASLLDEHPYIDFAVESGELGIQRMVKSVIGLTENVFDLRYLSCAYGAWENTDFYFAGKWYYDQYPVSGRRMDDFNMHMCDLMLHSLGLSSYASCQDVCVTPDQVPEEIPTDYVVVCDSVGSVPGQLKRWTEEGWDGLIRWLHTVGLFPVQLGTVHDPLLHSGVLDLRGKTTLRQSAGYLQKAKGYIGVEGGLFHLAKAVGCPAVVIFASTSEVCFAYPDTRVVSRRRCRPCWFESSWLQASCMRGSPACINLPEWKSVAVQAADMLGFTNLPLLSMSAEQPC
jgi:hypothetical protein